MIRQTDMPLDTHFPRWGCLNMVPVYALEEHTGLHMPYKPLATLARTALRTPVSWKPSVTVISYSAETGGFWNNDFDWWCYQLCEIVDPTWWMFPVGQQLPDGTLRWYSDEAWWIRQHPGMTGFRSYTFIANRYGRPGGGGHYVYEDVKRQKIVDPDPSLVGEYEIVPGAWLFYLGRRER